jgi:hypothetical protein
VSLGSLSIKSEPMIINPKNGVDQLLFGMKQNHVEAIYGKPSKQFKDEDGNVLCHYNTQKITLTFYEDENYRLGYIACSNPEATILGNKVIGKNVESIKADLPFKSWSVEDFDSFENHFNESNWLILQSEFDEIVRVEIGAIIKDNDEFDWKFKA